MTSATLLVSQINHIIYINGSVLSVVLYPIVLDVLFPSLQRCYVPHIVEQVYYTCFLLNFFLISCSSVIVSSCLPDLV
jgi:hypothetical protein